MYSTGKSITKLMCMLTHMHNFTFLFVLHLYARLKRLNIAHHIFLVLFVLLYLHFLTCYFQFFFNQLSVSALLQVVSGPKTEVLA